MADLACQRDGREKDDRHGQESERPLSPPDPADRGHQPEENESSPDEVLKPGGDVCRGQHLRGATALRRREPARQPQKW